MGRDERQNPFGRKAEVTLPPTVRDLFGRALAEGDGVFLGPQVQPLFKVTKIAPALDPNAGPNVMIITVSCSLQFGAARNQSNNEFVRVMPALEWQQVTGGKARLGVPEAETPPNDQPPAGDAPSAGETE